MHENSDDDEVNCVGGLRRARPLEGRHKRIILTRDNIYSYILSKLQAAGVDAPSGGGRDQKILKGRLIMKKNCN